MSSEALTLSNSVATSNLRLCRVLTCQMPSHRRSCGSVSLGCAIPGAVVGHRRTISLGPPSLCLYGDNHKSQRSPLIPCHSHGNWPQPVTPPRSPPSCSSLLCTRKLPKKARACPHEFCNISGPKKRGPHCNSSTTLLSVPAVKGHLSSPNVPSIPHHPVLWGAAPDARPPWSFSFFRMESSHWAY